MPAKAAVVRSQNLLATDDELGATSKSLYGDHKARISSNVHHIHDRVRFQSYGAAIQNCMKGKTVLHLGCGMGLLTMMAARAMAKHVVGVDTSAIVKPAAKIAEANKLTNLTFVQGKAEEAKLPIEKFDVIMCEWMGAFLINEPILKELLYCQQHYLAEGGIVCPDSSSIHVVGITDYPYYHDTCDYWDNVYGFNMKAMKPLVMQEASCCSIPKQCIATNSYLAHNVNIEALAKKYIAATTPEEKAAVFSFSANFVIKASKKCTVHFITFYIDCVFNNPSDPGANFVIGFHPGGRNTFTEVSVPLNEFLPVNAGDEITGSFSVRPSQKPGTTLLDVTARIDNAVTKIETTGSYNYTA